MVPGWGLRPRLRGSDCPRPYRQEVTVLKLKPPATQVPLIWPDVSGATGARLKGPRSHHHQSTPFQVPPLPSAMGLRDPRASAHYSGPAPAQLQPSAAPAQQAPTRSAGRGVVRTRLLSQPGGRVWRQGREVCRWQTPRYLSQETKEAAALGGGSHPRHRKRGWALGAAALSVARWRGNRFFWSLMLHRDLRLPQVTWGNSEAPDCSLKGQLCCGPRPNS